MKHYITALSATALHVQVVACRCGSLFVTDGRTGITADQQYGTHIRSEVQR